jgi:hypothetical protein
MYGHIGAEILCTIMCPIPMPFEQFSAYTNPQGKVYRRLEFDVEMSVVGTSLDFVVLVNGQEQARKSVYVSFKTK